MLQFEIFLYDEKTSVVGTCNIGNHNNHKKNEYDDCDGHSSSLQNIKSSIKSNVFINGNTPIFSGDRGTFFCPCCGGNYQFEIKQSNKGIFLNGETPISHNFIIVDVEGKHNFSGNLTSQKSKNVFIGRG